MDDMESIFFSKLAGKLCFSDALMILQLQTIYWPSLLNGKCWKITCHTPCSCKLLHFNCYYYL